MLSLEFVLSIGLGLFLLSTIQVSAQPLTKDTLTGNVTEVDISMNPAEPLPANGTVTISTEGATDTDMNALHLKGFTSLSSDTVIVTNQTIDIPMAEEEEDQSLNPMVVVILKRILNPMVVVILKRRGYSGLKNPMAAE